MYLVLIFILIKNLSVNKISNCNIKSYINILVYLKLFNVFICMIVCVRVYVCMCMVLRGQLCGSNSFRIAQQGPLLAEYIDP